MIAAISKSLNKIVCTILFTSILFISNAQVTDTAKKVFHLSGSTLVTNNGISFIPTFSLGKPATIITLSMGNKKWSFDPEFRFSLEGKPWSILFWGRYQLANSSKFKFTVGEHLGLSYNYPSVLINGISTDITQVKRYLATEMVPNYFINKSLSVGLYYLYSRGLDGNLTTHNTHFITLNTNISNIPVSKEFYLGFKPQVYYLQLDNQDGYFTSAAISILKKNFPICLSTIFNKKINTNIVTKDFVWNISLNYNFKQNFVRK